MEWLRILLPTFDIREIDERRGKEWRERFLIDPRESMFQDKGNTTRPLSSSWLFHRHVLLMSTR